MMVKMWSVEVIGAGRMGTALVRELRRAGVDVEGPSPRGATGFGAEIVLLAVPDAEIAAAARLIAPDTVVGHLSGATSLDVLAPHERFSLHPLTTVIVGPEAAGAGESADVSPFAGVSATVAASSVHALTVAAKLAEVLGMRAMQIEDQDRAAYHAAASIASNFLVTLEWVAEQLATSAGVDRAALAPLVAETVRNWAARGPEAALTGPIARGDAETVERQRAAVAERMPERLALFDELVRATTELAASARASATSDDAAPTREGAAPTPSSAKPSPGAAEATPPGATATEGES